MQSMFTEFVRPVCADGLQRLALAVPPRLTITCQAVRVLAVGLVDSERAPHILLLILVEVDAIFGGVRNRFVT